MQNARIVVIAVALAAAMPAVAQTPPLAPALVEDTLGPDAFPTAVPFGLPAEIPAPADNPLTAEAFALGRRLFFDPVLSIDRTVACASCHDPKHGFASTEARPLGVRGRRALRDAPTLYNRGFGTAHRWDGAAETLEQQVLLPISDPNEMDLPVDTAVARLADDADYRAAFEETFGEPPTRTTLARALASFVRGLLAGDSPVDRFQGGASTALNAAEKAGLWIYESKGRCWRCHSGANLSDEGFHNTGVGVNGGVAEEGRLAVTGDPADRGKFKTPTLRMLEETAPYMHDGSLATLEDVVQFYADGGRANEHLDPDMQPIELSATERANLVAFLRALSRPAAAPKDAPSTGR